MEIGANLMQSTCMPFHVKPIGIIHSPFAINDEAPIQGTFRPDARGQVEVFPEFEEGLKDVELFSHLFLVYIFDRMAGKQERPKPPGRE